MGHLSPTEQVQLQAHGIFGATLFCDQCIQPIIQSHWFVGKKNRTYCSVECRAKGENKPLPKYRKRTIDDWATPESRRKVLEDESVTVRNNIKWLVSVKKKKKFSMRLILKTIEPTTALKGGTVLRILRELLAQKELVKEGKRVVVGKKFKPIDADHMSIFAKVKPGAEPSPSGEPRKVKFPRNIKWAKA